MKKRIITLTSILLLIAATTYAPISFGPLNTLLIKLVEKRLDARIACRSLKIYLWRCLVADDIQVIGRGGFALSAEKATIHYDLVSIVTGRFHMRCNLDNGKFYRGGTIMNSLSDILYIQPLGNTTFETVQADLFVGRRDTVAHNLLLSSDKIKISGGALTDTNNNIKCLLSFSLDEDLTKEMPDEIKGSLFKNEQGARSNISVGIMGNYKKPTLRIMTERFRMKISS